MTPATVAPLAGSRLSELFADPRSALGTLVVLLVIWYAWVRVIADPDLERAKQVYHERRAEREAGSDGPEEQGEE